MEQQKIIFISHCILNTASKVVRSIPVCETAEEQRFYLPQFKRRFSLFSYPVPNLPCTAQNAGGTPRNSLTIRFFGNIAASF